MTLALGGLALDRGLLPEARRLVTLQRLFIEPQVLWIVLEPTSGHVALIAPTFATIR
jgi:hypothetical protein